MWHVLHAALANLTRLRRKREEGSSDPLVTVICLLDENQDRSLMTDLCRRNKWELFFAAEREEAERVLQELKPQIMLFDRDIAGRDWREFVTGFAAASTGACIMLVSKVIDDNLWNDLVSNGGYEVLRKPLREEEVSRAVKMAWSYWSSAVKRASSVAR
jgi:response regulator RpfG family c-di-GMP phosphodiesterase